MDAGFDRVERAERLIDRRRAVLLEAASIALGAIMVDDRRLLRERNLDPNDIELSFSAEERATALRAARDKIRRQLA